MNRTFKGFLKDYCHQLSGLKTSSLCRLCESAASDSPRVAEPLFLFALEEDRLEYLLSLSKGTWMEDEYHMLAQKVAPQDDAESFFKMNDIPDRYRKVWEAFEHERDHIEADRRVIALMCEKTHDALMKSDITRYRLCKDLNLNMGNVYAYLDSGDTRKVSRQTARRILEYATTAAELKQSDNSAVPD